MQSIPQQTGVIEDGGKLFKKYSVLDDQGLRYMTEEQLIAFINDHFTLERQEELQRQAVSKLETFDTDNNGIQIHEFLEFARMECDRKCENTYIPIPGGD